MSSDTFLVSILINNYNYGRFLRQAIDSALAQTWSLSEVVVVDDGSTDESCELIQSYGKSIVPVMKENGGQGSAFNAGFAASRGEIVCFLDSDDVFLPTKVERLVTAWRRNPEAGLIYHQLLFMDGDGKRMGRSWPSSVVHGRLRARVERAGGWWPVPTTSALACSRIYLENVLPMPEEPFKICADAYVGGLAPFMTDVAGIREPLAISRVHGCNNHNRSLQSESNVHLRMRRYEAELQQLKIAMSRFSISSQEVSLNDHYPYQWCCWRAGNVSRWKVLATVLRTPSMPFAMKCKALLKTAATSRL